MSAWNKGYCQGFDEAMDMCADEMELWHKENLRSLKNEDLNDSEIFRLEGAESESKAFVERIREVLKSRNPWKEYR